MMTFRRIFSVCALTALAGTASLAGQQPAAAKADESGSPHGVSFKDRDVRAAENTNATWEALESDNPHSVNFATRQSTTSTNANAAWSAAESGNPHNAERR